MNFKKSPLVNSDKKARQLANIENYPTLADLLREQNDSSHEEKTVHYRRDLDSIG